MFFEKSENANSEKLRSASVLFSDGQIFVAVAIIWASRIFSHLQADYVVLVQIHRAHIFFVIFVVNIIKTTRTVGVRRVIFRFFLFVFLLHICNPLSAHSFRNRDAAPCKRRVREIREHGRTSYSFREEARHADRVRRLRDSCFDCNRACLTAVCNECPQQLSPLHRKLLRE